MGEGTVVGDNWNGLGEAGSEVGLPHVTMVISHLSKLLGQRSMNQFMRGGRKNAQGEA